MTTPNNVAWGSANGTGVTGPYTLPFPLYSQSDATILTVTFVTGVSPVVYTNNLGTDYTFTSWTPLNNGQVQSPQITFTNAIPAPSGSTSYLIVFLLTPPGSQDTAITNYSDYFPMVHEQEFDLLAQATSQLNQWVGKSIKAPDYEYAGQTNQTLPAIAQRASMFPFFDAQGNFTVVAGITNLQTAITTYMANILTVVNNVKQFWNQLELPNEDFLDPTSPAPSGTVNNYNPTGITISNVGNLILEPSANLNLTGLLAPTESPNTLPNGYMQRLNIFNDSAYTITLKNNNSGSYAYNRFNGNGGSDYVIAANSSAELIYSTYFQSGPCWIIVP